MIYYIMHPDIVEKLKNKALEIEGVSDFGLSRVKGKRFYVIYNDHVINFGSKDGETYIDHGDEKKRKAWKARHGKIYNKNGLAYQDKMSPEYYSWNLLW
jgi:hypothetical protein